MKTICVYCGSSDNVNRLFIDSAYQMGKMIAQNGLRMVYGAGSTGLMGAVAKGAMENGGEVTGVMPQIFDTPQLAEKNITRFEVVDDIHTRKARMMELSDGFIALPGGYGTMEEFFEALTWAQIGIHQKPVGLLNTHQYYDGLLTFMENMEREGFIYEEHNQLLHVDTDPAELLKKMYNHQVPEGLSRWVDRN